MKNKRLLSNGRQSSRSSRGFTLIELLVVVAIIALLVAIMLPALKRARAYTRRIICLTHVSQIGKAIITYSQDNDDRMPAGGGMFAYTTRRKTDDHSIAWGAVLLLPYLGASQVEIEEGKGQAWAIWGCPAAYGGTIAKEEWTLPDSDDYDWKNVSYSQHYDHSLYSKARPGTSTVSDSVLCDYGLPVGVYVYHWANHHVVESGGKFIGVNAARIDGSADWVACEDQANPVEFESYQPSAGDWIQLFPLPLGK